MDNTSEKRKYNHVGEFIRERREVSKLTTRQLSEITEISPTRIARIELGQKSIFDLTLSQIDHLANALSVSLSDLEDLAKETEASRLAMLESENFNHVGEFIRKWREQHNYTTRELAEEIGCSASRISKVEAGERSLLHMDIREFAELAKVMQMPMEKLLKFAEETEEKRAEMHEAKKNALAEARKANGGK